MSPGIHTYAFPVPVLDGSSRFMDPDVVEMFRETSTRNDVLHSLMTICATRAQFVHVVCVGGGDVFIDRFWPKLEKHIRSMKLTVADRGTLTEMIRRKTSKQTRDPALKARLKRLRHAYAEFANEVLVSPTNVRYLNLDDAQEHGWYDHLLADVVFILVPDDMHIAMAWPWLKRAHLILVEKPYNQDLEMAEEFEGAMRKLTHRLGPGAPTTWVVPFDHYLAKIEEYAQAREDDPPFDDAENPMAPCGSLREASFAILEPTPLEPWRAESLRAGMTYDLFSHVLAMLCVELRIDEVPSTCPMRLCIARHRHCPGRVKAETYARFEFKLMNRQRQWVQVSGSIGKGIGRKHEKWLRFTGDNGGYVHLDLRAEGSKGFTKRGPTQRTEKFYCQTGAGHSELLETLFAGRFMASPVGAMSGDRAIAVLRILNRIHQRIQDHMSSMSQADRRRFQYEVGWSQARVDEVAVPIP